MVRPYLLLITYYLLLNDYFADFVALTTDEDTVLGICNINTLKVEVFSRRIVIISFDVGNAATRLVESDSGLHRIFATGPLSQSRHVVCIGEAAVGNAYH